MKAFRVSVNRDDLRLSDFDAGSNFYNRSKRQPPDMSQIPVPPKQKVIPMEGKLNSPEESQDPYHEQLHKILENQNNYFAPITPKRVAVKKETGAKPTIRNGK